VAQTSMSGDLVNFKPGYFGVSHKYHSTFFYNDKPTS